MGDTAERFGNPAAQFAERVRAVPDEAWDRQARLVALSGPDWAPSA